MTGEAIVAVQGLEFDGTVAEFGGETLSPTHFWATIDWGDGSTSTGTVVADGASYAVTGQHEYAYEGAYAMSVRVSITSTPIWSHIGDLALVLSPTDESRVQQVEAITVFLGRNVACRDYHRRSVHVHG